MDEICAEVKAACKAVVIAEIRENGYPQSDSLTFTFISTSVLSWSVLQKCVSPTSQLCLDTLSYRC